MNTVFFLREKIEEGGEKRLRSKLLHAIHRFKTSGFGKTFSKFQPRDHNVFFQRLGHSKYFLAFQYCDITNKRPEVAFAYGESRNEMEVEAFDEIKKALIRWLRILEQSVRYDDHNSPCNVLTTITFNDARLTKQLYFRKTSKLWVLSLAAGLAGIAAAFGVGWWVGQVDKNASKKFAQIDEQFVDLDTSKIKPLVKEDRKAAGEIKSLSEDVRKELEQLRLDLNELAKITKEIEVRFPELSNRLSEFENEFIDWLLYWMDGLADVGSDVEELIEKSEQNKEEINTIDKRLFAVENKASLIEMMLDYFGKDGLKTEPNKKKRESNGKEN